MELIKREALLDIAEQQGHVTVDDIVNLPTIDPIKAAGGCYCRECRWGQEDDIGVMHCHKFRCNKKPGGYCDDGEPGEAQDDG